MAKRKKKAYYAVKSGRGGPAVYLSWDECSASVTGFSGARFKGFAGLDEALAFAGVAGVARATAAPARSAKRARCASPAGAAQDSEYTSAQRLKASVPPTGRAIGVPCADALGFTHLLRFDGGSRGNPGPGGSGACLYKLEQPGATGGTAAALALWSGWRFLGHCTNNEAEYDGLALGLQAARRLLDPTVVALRVEGDSKLVVQQIGGGWKVKAANLRRPHDVALGLVGCFPRCALFHIPRAGNSEADALANAAMDSEDSGEVLHRDCSSASSAEVGSGAAAASVVL